MRRRAACLTLMVVFLLAVAATARAELTVEGWLELYEGKTEEALGRRLARETANLMAATYVLGMADSVIALRVLSCPPGFIPLAGELADQVAAIVRTNQQQPHREFSMPVAVMLVLAVRHGCAQTGSKGK